MLELQYDPPVDAAAKGQTFIQTIRLMRGGRTLGWARWHADADGAIQILDLAVQPAQQRKGHGSQLMAAMILQGMEYWKHRGTRLRRMWAVLQQKNHMTGRAFLMRHGFHQVGVVPDLLPDQDSLVYMRGMD